MRAIAASIGVAASAVVALFVSACSAPAAAPAAPAPTWRSARSLPGPRFEAYAAVAEGKIFYLGGITGVMGDQKSARESDRLDVYDPVNDTWSAGPSLPAGGPKHHLAVAVIPGADGGGIERIYLLGGFTGIIGGADVAGRFVPNAQTWVLEGGLHGSWRRLADQPLARGSATAQSIAGTIYVAGGGADEKGAFTDVLAYDPIADRWTKRASMATPREHVSSCALTGRMLVIGGWAGDDRITVSANESYEPAHDRWTSLPPMPTSRGGMGAAAIGDVCHVVGGERWDRGLPGTFAVAESFDVVRGTWRSDPPMPTARHGIGVASLGGSIYVVGGGPIMGNSYTDVVEVFTP